MYIRTGEGLGSSAATYLYDSSINGIGEAPATNNACLAALKCVPHQHVPRICTDGKSFTSLSPRTMMRSAMNPGFFRARDGFHEFDTVLHSKLQNLILNKPEYAAMLAEPSKQKRDATPGDRMRVAVVDLTGDYKLCKPGYADWGSTFPITGGSTSKVAMLYAAHQLIYDLNEMARTGGIKTLDQLKKKALSEVWSQLNCPPDLDWLVEPDSTQQPVRVKMSKNLNLHLTIMVDARSRESSVASAIQLIMRLGFEYIASLLWQSGLRHSRTQGMWIRNTYQHERITATVDPKCNYKKSFGDKERIFWYHDPTDDTELSLTALSVVSFFTLLAQRRLVNPDASVLMEDLLAHGCFFPLNWLPTIPGMKIRATKCGLTSDVMHVAMLRESEFESTPKRYALAILVRRNNENRSKTMTALHSLVKDVDQLIRENNP